MIRNHSISLFIICLLVSLSNIACNKSGAETEDPHDHEQENDIHSDEANAREQEVVHLLGSQMEVMDIGLGKFRNMSLSSSVKSNGHLELPPQNKASLSALVAGRVKSILVLEGSPVRKGQVLARLEHPSYIVDQQNYMETLRNLDFLRTEFERKEALFADSITSQKDFESAKANFRVAEARIKGLRARLEMLGISIEALEKGKITTSIPITSPISGFVRLVEVNIGMSVQPEQEMFEIVDNDHIHIDLMVYEKDIDKVKEGQKVQFTLSGNPENIFEAKIFALGKAFEHDPKAVKVHAEIENKTGNLLPGMYVDARIETGKEIMAALPKEAIVSDGGLSYIFVRQETSDSHESHENGHAHDESGHENEFIFRKVEVSTGVTDMGYTQVAPAEKIANDPDIVTKGAYYLLAEQKKGEGGHGHHH